METYNITRNSGIWRNASTEMPETPLYIIVVASVMYGVTFLLGILGNINVIMIVSRFKNMRTRMNYFLVNLSVSDFFIILVCIPSATVDLMAKEAWYFGEAMCKIVPFVENVVTLSSVLSILAITWDRYRGICFPLQYNEGRGRVIAPQLLVVWLVSIAASVPMVLIPVFRDSKFRDGTPIKVCRMPINHVWILAYFIVVFALFFCVMFCLLLFFYGKICHTLLYRKQLINQLADRYAHKMLKERRQMVRLMLVVILMFFICLVPQRAISLWLIFADKSQLISLQLEGYLLLKTFPRVLVYMNSAVNPIIYNLTSSKFKNASRKLLCSNTRICTCKAEADNRKESAETELNFEMEFK